MKNTIITYDIDKKNEIQNTLNDLLQSARTDLKSSDSLKKAIEQITNQSFLDQLGRSAGSHISRHTGVGALIMTLVVSCIGTFLSVILGA